VTGARGDAVSLGTRRPTALTRAGRDAGNRRSIAFAFAANVVVAAAKLVYAAPQEAILAARIHPSPGPTGDGLAELLDRLDERLRSELPEISAVFIDVTARHGSGEAARPGTRHPTDASTGPCADASVRP
jgi:hypothetical protein